MLRIARYGKGKYWALYDGQELVAVTVYKRGAQEVVRRLEAAHQAQGEDTPRPPCLAPARTNRQGRGATGRRQERRAEAARERQLAQEGEHYPTTAAEHDLF